MLSEIAWIVGEIFIWLLSDEKDLIFFFCFSRQCLMDVMPMCKGARDNFHYPIMLSEKTTC